MIAIRTNMSRAYWCSNTNGKIAFESASMPAISSADQIAWLDILLEGGLRIPGDEAGNTALTVLLSGPPGSGKTTFALEFVYRLLTESASTRKRWHTLYVSTESSASWLFEKAQSYGWDVKEETFHALSSLVPREVPHIDVLETDYFARHIEYDSNLTESTRKVIQGVAALFKRDKAAELTDAASDMVRKQVITEILHQNDPDVLVIDSLNTVDDRRRSELLRRFLQLKGTGPKLILFVLDAGDESARPGFWAYACDVIIHLDKKIEQGYMIRTIEIAKARYQSHVWGVHQLKVYGPRPVTNQTTAEQKEDLRRAHPYREEGGIFIFPSIHFYLSQYKRQSPSHPPDSEDTRIGSLNEILKGGLPKGRCTGMLGLRGGHKSHLGYLHVLHRIADPRNDEVALIVSLRDDEGMAKQTMRSILSEEFKGAGIALEDLEKRDRLEILYYPPGFITPEEFFHRMMLSVQRLRAKNPGGGMTVLFNSLDQLGSRFPLCSSQEIFVPGIIEALCAERITSIFIGVSEPGQPPEQYGLLSMADLILSFNKHEFQRVDYLGHVEKAHQYSSRLNHQEVNELKGRLGEKLNCVVIRVERFAGGQTAGAGGILELVKPGTEERRLYNREGLCFTPFSRNFDQGSPLPDTHLPPVLSDGNGSESREEH